jgi:hypothetical protein
MSKILISYRRDDSADVAGRIYDRLIQQFGRDGVFKDIDSIPFGVDFRTYLDAQVAKCDVFLAVIGPNWMKIKGRKGKCRLEEPQDYVRIEIESALKREILVIPLLVSGASIPEADKLPVSIQKLTYRNGIAIRVDPDFHRDMDRLIDYLKDKIQLAVHDLKKEVPEVLLEQRSPSESKIPPIYEDIYLKLRDTYYTLISTKSLDSEPDTLEAISPEGRKRSTEEVKSLRSSMLGKAFEQLGFMDEVEKKKLFIPPEIFSEIEKFWNMGYDTYMVRQSPPLHKPPFQSNKRAYSDDELKSQLDTICAAIRSAYSR